MNDDWLSVHLFYSEPFETLLLEGVKPFIEYLREKQMVTHYFFIRYWEGGPHIRLRLKGKSENIEEVLRDHFSTFFKKKPSEINELSWHKTLPNNRFRFPNDTIQFIRYEPEIDRYGGRAAIEVAEKHFMDSSDAVLEILNDSSVWNYEYALGKALQLHLGFVFSLGMSQNEMELFFEHIFSTLLPWASGTHNRLGASSVEQEKLRTDIVTAFRKSFSNQSKELIQFVELFWEALKKNTGFEQKWLNRWLGDIRNTERSLIAYQKDGLLDFGTRLNFTHNTKTIPLSIYKRWYIYQSFIHMTNNRLGILNRDEGYLGYILKESIKEITGA